MRVRVLRAPRLPGDKGCLGVPGGKRTHGHSDIGTVTANPPENPGLSFLQEPQNRGGRHSVTHIYPIRKFRSSHELHLNKP